MGYREVEYVGPLIHPYPVSTPFAPDLDTRTLILSERSITKVAERNEAPSIRFLPRNNQAASTRSEKSLQFLT